RKGMDAAGYMPGDAEYNPNRKRVVHEAEHAEQQEEEPQVRRRARKEELVGAGVSNDQGNGHAEHGHSSNGNGHSSSRSYSKHSGSSSWDDEEAAKAAKSDEERASADRKQAFLALEEEAGLPEAEVAAAKSTGWLNKETLHEVFMNPGIFLLFA